jgi:hypothetical protein
MKCVFIHYGKNFTVLICPPQSPAGHTGIPRNLQESSGLLQDYTMIFLILSSRRKNCQVLRNPEDYRAFDHP